MIIPDSRRVFLKRSITYSAIAISTVLTHKVSFADWIADNFSPSKLQDTLTRLYANSEITQSEHISLKLPKIAENGALVPITVSSTLSNVENIAILVEKNPVPLAATFKLADNMMPFISARLKMAETSDVIAIIKADDMLFCARQNVKVTIGGCGG